MLVSDEPAGSHCAAGGTSIDVGIDGNLDGVLDPDEIDDTQYVCNGVDGVDGADGVDGTDGAPGADGADGAPGATGAEGVPGTPGADGAPGEDGADGAPGKSGGCGCRTRGGPSSPWGLGTVALLGLLWARRRRRRTC